MPVVDLTVATERTYDLCVIGSGPAGIALAGDCVRRGMSVIVLEQGGLLPVVNGERQEVGALLPNSPHDPLELTSCQALGGGIHWWGGRAVPLDPEEFTPPSDVSQPAWPIDYDAYAKWIEPASRFLGCEASYEIDPPKGWGGVSSIALDRAERLCQGPGLAKRLSGTLLASDGPDTLLNAAVTGFDSVGAGEGEAITHAVLVHSGTWAKISAKRFALCAGGLETTRLLLAEQKKKTSLFGGAEGPLGRFYMGHIAGSVSEISFARARAAASFGYRVPEDQVRPARRRMTLRGTEGGRVAFWVENLDLADPRHNSGIQSLKHLVMSNSFMAKYFVSDPLRVQLIKDRKVPVLAHLRNIVSDLPATVGYAGSTLMRRIWRDDRPADWLVKNQSGRYRLAYHAEQLPNPDSRVTLGNEVDSFGRHKLMIDFRFAERDFESVADAHYKLRDALDNSGLAKIHLPASAEDLMVGIRDQARDGYHQIGTTAMSRDAQQGVVDENCRAHGLSNLYIASSSIFPRSSQANPTLSIVCFALRLAEHLSETPGNPVSALAGRG
ncbi:hypothetical protein KHP62_16190 [Rhodobacteraceae bacterium NNCM2]|nr:hypothetical protein [Coraliihabitans acroporae]